MENYSSAIDGIPGIMPGIVTLPTPPEFVEESKSPKISSDLDYKQKTNVRKSVIIPQPKRKMMPCNKLKKSEWLLPLKQNLSLQRSCFFNNFSISYFKPNKKGSLLRKPFFIFYKYN